MHQQGVHSLQYAHTNPADDFGKSDGHDLSSLPPSRPREPALKYATILNGQKRNDDLLRDPHGQAGQADAPLNVLNMQAALKTPGESGGARSGGGPGGLGAGAGDRAGLDGYRDDVTMASRSRGARVRGNGQLGKANDRASAGRSQRFSRPSVRTAEQADGKIQASLPAAASSDSLAEEDPRTTQDGPNRWSGVLNVKAEGGAGDVVGGHGSGFEVASGTSGGSPISPGLRRGPTTSTYGLIIT
jgi:hypothetical protein